MFQNQKQRVIGNFESKQLTNTQFPEVWRDKLNYPQLLNFF